MQEEPIINIISKLHPLERKVLPHLKDTMSFSSLLHDCKLSEIGLSRALQWLENKGVIATKTEEEELVVLDNNGLRYRETGLPEARFLRQLAKSSAILQEILKSASLDPEEANICLGTLRQKAAISFTQDKKISITDHGRKLLDKPSLEEQFLQKDFPLNIASLLPEERFAFDNLKRRKNILRIELKKLKTITLTDLGKKIISSKIKAEDYLDSLTPEMLKTGSWQDKKFRHYDIMINVPRVSGGKRHFVNQAADYIRSIWIELGFKEMQGPLVQTSFWDLDALFVPQDHPARQMQDTFFIKDPAYGTLPPIAKKIKAAHENGGGTGSTGWQGTWNEDIAKQVMLITHDTYLSAQVLANIKKEDLPVKTFQIMKVFRNEALDWKHLFEFYQIGGIVVANDVNFQHLLGYLKLFFSKMGFPDVRIRPAHFPYTEPSAEIEVLHPRNKQWIELGGAGIFRPEVTKPLLGFECPVLAWGFGMSRTISEYWNISDIRDLHKNDVKQIRDMKFWMK